MNAGKRFRLPQVRRCSGSRGSLDSHDDFLAGWGFFPKRPPLLRASEREAEPSLQCRPRSFRPTCAYPQCQWGIAPTSKEASDRQPVPLEMLATANGAAGRWFLMPCHSFGPGFMGPCPLCPSTSRSYDRRAILKDHGSQAPLASRRPAGGCAQGPGAIRCPVRCPVRLPGYHWFVTHDQCRGA